NALNPETNPEAAKKRRDLALGKRRNEGFITEDEYAQAVATDINLEMNPLPSGCLYAEAGCGYFCDYVQRLVLADPAFGPDNASRQRMLDRGGLDITTTLHSELQRAAVETAKTTVPADENEGIGAALVTVQQDTGNIKAMAQTTEYSVEEERGSSTLNF